MTAGCKGLQESVADRLKVHCECCRSRLAEQRRAGCSSHGYSGHIVVPAEVTRPSCGRCQMARSTYSATLALCSKRSELDVDGTSIAVGHF